MVVLEEELPEERATKREENQGEMQTDGESKEGAKTMSFAATDLTC